MQQEQLWYLLSRKLAGEATGEDITALQKLLDNDPEAKALYELLADFWNTKDNGPVEDLHDKFTELMKKAGEGPGQ